MGILANSVDFVPLFESGMAMKGFFIEKSASLFREVELN